MPYIPYLKMKLASLITLLPNQMTAVIETRLGSTAQLFALLGTALLLHSKLFQPSLVFTQDPQSLFLCSNFFCLLLLMFRFVLALALRHRF